MIKLSQWNERGSAAGLGPPPAVPSPHQPLNGEEASDSAFGDGHLVESFPIASW